MQTASAFAQAVASATAECILSGDATASAFASAEAKAKAEIWVASYFDAFAAATNCETCEAWAGSWGYIEKWVFLEAIAKAQVKVCDTSNLHAEFHHNSERICLC
jgi:hypothetical protein